MKLDEFIALRSAKKKYEEMSGYYNGDPATNGEFELIKQLAKYIGLFVDIGYNQGDVSKFIDSVKTGINILGFEPNPKLADAAAHKIIRTALSDQSESNHSFNIHEAESGVSSLSTRTQFNPSFRAGFSQINVSVSRLDHFVKELNPGDGKLFLKIDVEGYEAKVIRGGAEVFSKYKPIGYFEYGIGWLETGERFGDFFYYLDSLGYSSYRITPLGLEHIRFFHITFENYVSQNILFCPKGYLDDKMKHIDIPTEFSSAKYFLFENK